MPDRRDGVRGERRARHRLRDAQAAAVPRQRVPAARRDLARVPRHPARRPDVRDAAPAAGRRAPRSRSTAGSSSSPARPARASRRRSPRSSTTSTRRGSSTSSRSRIRSRCCTPTAGASSTSARSASTPMSFAQALRRALRQDPDVILIGELRDAETARDGAAGRRVGPPRPLDACTPSTRPRRSAGWSSSSRPSKQPMVRSILAGVLQGRRQPAAAAAHRTAAASQRSR